MSFSSPDYFHFLGSIFVRILTAFMLLTNTRYIKSPPAYFYVAIFEHRMVP